MILFTVELMSFALYTLHMYYMYRLLNYISIEEGGSMGYYRFNTKLYSFQLKSQPWVYS